MRQFPGTARWCIPFAILISLLVGCDKKTVTSVSLTSDTEARKEWLIVTTDPAKLDRARETAKKLEAKSFADFYKGLTKSAYLNTETNEMIAAHRDDAVKRLTQLAASSMAKNQGIGAALVLCRLKEPGGLPRVKEILRSGKDEQKVRVLGSLGLIFAARTSEDFQSYRQFIFDDSDLVDLVMRQMDSAKSDVVLAAVQLSGTLKFPGLSDRILALLESSKDLDRDRLVYWLSQGELTEPIFEFAMSDAERKRISSDKDWSGSLYEAFAKSKNEKWSRIAREVLILKLTATPEKTKGSYTGGRIGLVDTVAETATKDDLSRIKKLAKREHGYYATSLLAAWIRLDPKSGRKTLLEWLSQPDRRSAAINTAAKVYARTGDREIVEALQAVSNDLTPQELYSICHALQTIDGEEADKLLTSLLPRLLPAQRQYFQRATSDITMEELLDAVKDSGVLPEDAMSAAAAQVRHEHGGPADATFPENLGSGARPHARDFVEDFEDNDPPGLLQVLLAANCALYFDTETGELPCRHDRLLLDFAKASRGRFVPEAVSEEWLQKKKGDDEVPYRVQFIHGGRLYDGELQNLGDWYDVERLTAMVNRALEDAEIPERFVAGASDGQMATLIFADPRRLTPLAEKFHMPLSNDVAEATKKGLEFERVVKDRLNED